jgi:hypothetical protein
VLSLNDSRWSTLHAEGGSDQVPQLLRGLLDHPDETTRLARDGWSLCSNEVTWSAAFAAAPHLIAAAKAARPESRLEYLCFLGMIAMYRVPDNEADQVTACPPDLKPQFQEALCAGESMAAEALAAAEKEPDLRRLLAAVAAFKGFSGFARGITDLSHERRHDESREIAF